MTTITFLVKGEEVSLEIEGKREAKYWFRDEYYVRCPDGKYREQSVAARRCRQARQPLLLMPESEKP